jgi:hypothetical protein
VRCRLVDTWSSFAGAQPFAELKEVKRFADRRSAVTRIWTSAQRLGKALEQEQHIVPPAPVVRAAKAIAPTAAAPTALAQALVKSKATKDTTGHDGAPAPKQREGTRKATVIALLERADGATLEEIMAATAWQKHSVRGFISTLGSKHGYTIVSTRREECIKKSGSYAAFFLNCGYHRRNTSTSSSFKTLVRVCNKRWAPRKVHPICCFFTNLRLTTWLMVDSTNAVLMVSPCRLRSPKFGMNSRLLPM